MHDVEMNDTRKKMNTDLVIVRGCNNEQSNSFSDIFTKHEEGLASKS